MQEPTVDPNLVARNNSTDAIPSSGSRTVSSALVLDTDSVIRRVTSSDSRTDTDNDHTSSSGSSPEYDVEDLSVINPDSKKPSPNKIRIQRRPSDKSSFHDKDSTGSPNNEVSPTIHHQRQQQIQPQAPSSSSSRPSSQKGYTDTGPPSPQYPPPPPPPPPPSHALPRKSSFHDVTVGVSNSRTVSDSGQVSASSSGIISNIHSPLISSEFVDTWQSNPGTRTASCDEDAKTVDNNRRASRVSSLLVEEDPDEEQRGSTASYSSASLCASLEELDDLDPVFIQQSNIYDTGSNTIPRPAAASAQQPTSNTTKIATHLSYCECEVDSSGNLITCSYCIAVADYTADNLHDPRESTQSVDRDGFGFSGHDDDDDDSDATSDDSQADVSSVSDNSPVRRAHPVNTVAPTSAVPASSSSSTPMENTTTTSAVHQPLIQVSSTNTDAHAHVLVNDDDDDDIWGPTQAAEEYNSDFDSPPKYPTEIDAIWTDLPDDEDVTQEDASLSSRFHNPDEILAGDIWNEAQQASNDGNAVEILDRNYTPVKEIPTDRTHIDVTPNAALALAAMLASTPSDSPLPASQTEPSNQGQFTVQPSSSQQKASKTETPAAYVLPTLAMPTSAPGISAEEMSIDDMVAHLSWRPTVVASDTSASEPEVGKDSGSIMNAWKAAADDGDIDRETSAYTDRSQLAVWEDEEHLPEEALYVKHTETLSPMVSPSAAATSSGTSHHSRTANYLTSSTAASSDRIVDQHTLKKHPPIPALPIVSSQPTIVPVSEIESPKYSASTFPASKIPVVILIGPKSSDAQITQYILTQRKFKELPNCTCIIGKDLHTKNFPTGCATMPLERDIESLFQSKLLGQNERVYDSILLNLCGLPSATKQIGNLMHTLRKNGAISTAYRICSVVTVFEYGKSKPKTSKNFSSLTSDSFLRFQKRGVTLTPEAAYTMDKFQKFKEYVTLADLVFVSSSRAHDELMMGYTQDDWLELLEAEAQSVNPFVHVHAVEPSSSSSNAKNTSTTNTSGEIPVFSMELMFQWDAYDTENYCNFDFESLPAYFKPYSATRKATTDATSSPSKRSESPFTTGAAVKPMPPPALSRVIRQTVTADSSPLSTPRGNDYQVTTAATAAPSSSTPPRPSSTTPANSGSTASTGDKSFHSVVITIAGDMNVLPFNSFMNTFFTENAQQHKLFKCFGYLAFNQQVQGAEDKFVFIGVQNHLILHRTRSTFTPGGERCSRLVFVGRQLDVESLLRNLRNCLVDPSTQLTVKHAYS